MNSRQYLAVFTIADIHTLEIPEKFGEVDAIHQNAHFLYKRKSPTRFFDPNYNNSSTTTGMSIQVR